jgi:two-component system, OmpR family, response regulator ChvI
MATARPPPSSTSSENNNNKKIRILLVDDEYDVATSLKVLIEDEDYGEEEEKQDTNSRNEEFEVDAFNDPELVLSNFKAGRYDLLLLDIVMPKMNGFELYEKMKNIDDKVKVCFITAYMINNAAVMDLFPSSAEIDCFIRKPIKQKELKNKISEELKRSL